MYECLTIKQGAVEKYHPKLVILSGSNALFGFSAQRMHDVYGVSAVNAAVHAGLGIDYILYYARQQIAPGRVFVLPLEYQLYGKRELAHYALLYQMTGYDPEYFLSLSFTDKLTTIAEISLFNRVDLVKNLLWRKPRSESDGYQSRTLNSYGDQTANRIELRTKSMLDNVKRQAPALFLHDDAAWQAIAKFASDAKNAGAKVVLAYPNIYSGALDLKRNSSFFRELNPRADAIGLQIIGTPSASAFEDGDTFDTVYHQNAYGQTRSTDRLMGELHAAKLF